MSDTKEKQQDGGAQEKTSSDHRRTRSLKTTSDRLPSIRQKRDLTLGGKPKRVFTPTIPPRRVKKADQPQAAPTPPPPSPNKDKKQGKGLSQKEKQERKRRDRKREVVTSASVFSMGPAELLQDSRVSSSSRLTSTKSEPRSAHNDRQGLERVKIKMEDGHSPSKYDDDEDKTDVELMDTTSVARPLSSVFRSSNPPVTLPLDRTLHLKCRTQALPSTTASVSSVQRQPRVVTSKDEDKKEEEEDMDTNVTVPPRHHPHSVASADDCSRYVDQIFSPSKNSKGSFLLLQLPDRLPLHPPQAAEEADKQMATTLQDEPGQLRDVPEGLIGKLTVHQSGRVQLCLGSTHLNVTQGTLGGFLQQLVSVRATDSTPSLTVLGQLSHRVICSPDLDSFADLS